MLLLFKGQLSLHDIMWGMPYKRLFELKDERQNRLLEEQKELDNMYKEQRNEEVRNSILAK
jgi:hypothetical protein